MGEMYLHPTEEGGQIIQIEIGNGVAAVYRQSVRCSDASIHLSKPISFSIQRERIVSTV